MTVVLENPIPASDPLTAIIADICVIRCVNNVTCL